jgi:hypothetical protein
MKTKRDATCSPHSVLRGTSSGNRYQAAREDCIDPFIMWMEHDHPEDIAQKSTRPRVLRNFTMNPIAPQCYDQLVPWITWQYELATYLRAVDSCFASTTSMQGDGPLYRYAVIDSPSDESSCDDCLTFAEIEGRLMVTFITINTTVKVDNSDNENEYI